MLNIGLVAKYWCYDKYSYQGTGDLRVNYLPVLAGIEGIIDVCSSIK